MKWQWLSRIRRQGKYRFDSLATDRIKRNILQAFPFWTASLITGLVAVGYTKLFGYSEGLLHSILHWKPWMIFIVTPLCFFIAWYMVQLFAPNARGSGIPQVMAAIDLSTPRHKEKINRLLSFPIILTKIGSSLMMVLGGGAIGREGPTIQVSGSIFSIIQKWIPASWPRLSKQSFILTGAAAGLAAAFNTPLGGVVFAMEELAKVHVRFFRTALFSAVIISGLTAQGLLGPYLYLGYPDVKNLHILILLSVAATAVLSGMAGSFMCKMTLRMMRWKASFNQVQSLLFVIFAGLLIASIAYFLNEQVLGSGKDLMNNVLFSPEKNSSWHTVLFRILGPIICFNTGAAGGIFAPSLAAGASIGAFFSQLFHFVDSNANILILCGMVGFLTGVTRTPFTSAILVLEMTDRHSVIFHLMLAALISHIAALIVDKHSFYEQLKHDYVKQEMNRKEEEKAIEVQ